MKRTDPAYNATTIARHRATKRAQESSQIKRAIAARALESKTGCIELLAEFCASELKPSERAKLLEVLK